MLWSRVAQENRTDGGCNPKYWSSQGYRKPNFGMADVALYAYNNHACWGQDIDSLDEYDVLNPEQVLYVGDRDSDEEMAERFGCRFHWAKDFIQFPCVELEILDDLMEEKEELWRSLAEL
ncbi:MAG: HAD hydrolase-like protein [Cyanobacteria bacterium P01_F01_bin.150]